MVRTLNKEDTISNGIRNIGHLPEAVLVHILSFLPIQDAVRTSVLSKEWRSLWKSIDSIIFNEMEWGDNCYRKASPFKDCIDRVLLLHSPSSIKVFQLHSCRLGIEDHSRLNGWVSNVVRHNVQEITLELCLVDTETFWLPDGLFTCNTLVKLNLRFPRTTNLNLPSEIRLPNLKVLSLEKFTILDRSSFQQLISGSALERLRLSGIKWERIRAVRISGPKLKHLTIKEPEYPQANRCEVMICDCNLECFKLSWNCISNEYLTFNTSSIYVRISLQDGIGKQVAHLLNKLLHGISAVHKLCLEEANPELFGGRPELYSAWSNWRTFNALDTLQLGYLTAEIIKRGVLGKILQSTPRLRTLHLYETAGYTLIGDDDCEKIFDPVPSCFFSSLKKVKMYSVFLGPDGPYLSKAMLKYATALEEFVFSGEHCRHHDAIWNGFCNKLISCPRGSKICKIIFKRWWD